MPYKLYLQKILTTTLIVGVLFGIWMKIQNIWLYSPLDHIFSDPQRHWEYSQRVPDQYLFAAIDPIGFQVWIRTIMTITLNSKFAVNVYAAGLSILNAFIWFLVLRKINPGKKILNLCGLVVFILLPSWTEIFSYFMTETLFLPALGLSLYFTFKYLNSDSKLNNLRIIWITFLWLFTTLTRFVALPLAIISLAYLVIIKSSKKPVEKLLFSHIINQIQNLDIRNLLKHLFIIVFTSIVILVPVGFRNYNIIGVFAPFGYGAMNQIYTQSRNEMIIVNIYIDGKNTESWWFGSPSNNTKPLEPFFGWESNRAGALTINPDISKGNKDWDDYLSQNKLDLQKYGEIVKENFIYFFFGESWPDSNRVHPLSNISYLMRWVWFPLFVIISLGNIWYFYRKRKFELLPVLVMLCTLAILFNVSAIMEGRYRKPFEGLWILNLFWLASKLNFEKFSSLWLNKKNKELS